MKPSKASPTPFIIVVHGSANNSESHTSAQQFIDAVYHSFNSISQVFFYGEATTICGCYPAQSKLQRKIQNRWLTLSKQYNFQLNGCISSALKRGIIDAQESLESARKINLLEGFKLEGLGVIAEALVLNNKFIEFGG